MTRPGPAQRAVLVLSCQDAPGIVHAVSGVLLEQRCTIVESSQFHSDTSGDPSSGTFYLRVEFAAADGEALDLPRPARGAASRPCSASG